MGFVHKPKTYTLRPGGELAGLEIVARGLSMGRLLTVSALMAKLEEDDAAAGIDATTQLVDVFSQALQSWNMEQPDEAGIPVPVPPNSQAVADLEFDVLLTILTDWIGTMTGVPAPLGSVSPSGGTFPEASLPMAELSQSLVS